MYLFLTLVKKKKLGMSSGGTGITPVFQVIQSILLNDDDLEITLLFGNRSEDDILLFLNNPFYFELKYFLLFEFL